MVWFQPFTVSRNIGTPTQAHEYTHALTHNSLCVIPLDEHVVVAAAHQFRRTVRAKRHRRADVGVTSQRLVQAAIRRADHANLSCKENTRYTSELGLPTADKQQLTLRQAALLVHEALCEIAKGRRDFRRKYNDMASRTHHKVIVRKLPDKPVTKHQE